MEIKEPLVFSDNLLSMDNSQNLIDIIENFPNPLFLINKDKLMEIYPL